MRKALFLALIATLAVTGLVWWWVRSPIEIPDDDLPQPTGYWRRGPPLEGDPEELARLLSLPYTAGSRVASVPGLGVVEYDRERAQPGLNLYVSGHDSEALLIDMEGVLEHRWGIQFIDAAPDSDNATEHSYMRRVALARDGDLIVLWQGQGLARIDLRSRLEWSRDVGVYNDLFYSWVPVGDGPCAPPAVESPPPTPGGGQAPAPTALQHDGSPSSVGEGPGAPPAVESPPPAPGGGQAPAPTALQHDGSPSSVGEGPGAPPAVELPPPAPGGGQAPAATALQHDGSPSSVGEGLHAPPESTPIPTPGGGQAPAATGSAALGDCARETLIVIHKLAESRAGLSDRPVLNDHLLWLDADTGETLRSLSLLDALAGSEWASALERRPDQPDILHANTVTVLDQAMVEGSPFEPGWILFSLREVSLIGVLDPETEEIVWALSGPPFTAQHEPVLLPGGPDLEARILLFDNKAPEGRASRALEVSLEGEVLWTWPQAASPGEGGQELASPLMGTVQRLVNGNTLIVESEGGSAIEVTPEGEVVWRFETPHRSGEQGRLIAVMPEMVRIEVPGWMGGDSVSASAGVGGGGDGR